MPKAGTSRSALDELVLRLARKGGRGAEANVQADVRQFLLSAPLELEEGDVVELETPVGDGKRIDVEVGATVIEVKRDLRKGRVLENAREQLAGYVQAREEATGSRYVGLLTDGAEWLCHQLREGELQEVASFRLESKDPRAAALVDWLDGVLATTAGARPTPRSIESGLGAESSSHALDRASLEALYQAGAEIPSVQMKRMLWAKLLTSALGTQFRDDDSLFVEHTLLVNSAEIIAHAVLGITVADVSPSSLLTGATLDTYGVHGVVEMDFFDWVLEVPGGEAFVRTLSRRVGRFDWSAVEHDVLKVLYESIIGRETRRRLGEYYTPDWLADRIVGDVVREPLTERVLDPACGSGTFLFYAVRRFVESGEAGGLTGDEILERVTAQVMGVDLHPVAVALARVTYLLAVGRERLSGEHPAIRVPVYLGDSMQWQKSELELLSSGFLTIETTDGRELFSAELRFPEHLLADSRVFDELVQGLIKKATGRKPGARPGSVKGLLDRLAIKEADRDSITTTYKTLCRLHDEGRNHIWGYYVRNLARPAWLSRRENRVDVLVGNPPWLAYRHMPGSMQKAFRSMSESRGLWRGGSVSTQQDLSVLFLARTTQLYLKKGGHFGIVLPNAVLDRTQFEGFRAGRFEDASEPTNLAFGEPWDLKRLRPHFFPRGCAVALGGRAEEARAMPETVQQWRGRAKREHASWAEVEPAIERESVGYESYTLSDEPASVYAGRFANGASVFPRLFFLVSRSDSGPLGRTKGAAAVESKRSATEKKPWKELAPIRGVVETEFLRPVCQGEHALPFRSLPPALSVIPLEKERLLEPRSERIDRYPGLADWMAAAEDLWLEHRSSERLSLLGRLDYHRELTRQFPIQPERVVYAKSGMHLAACRIRDARAVMDHTLYWATAAGEDEAHYLCAIINAAKTTELARPLMSYGKDERHIDKHLWKLPIPEFDAKNPLHKELSALGKEAEVKVAALALRDVHFATQRRQVRAFLEETGLAARLDSALSRLLDR